MVRVISVVWAIKVVWVVMVDRMVKVVIVFLAVHRQLFDRC